MVVRISEHQEADQLFHALSDATRRTILMRSMQSESSVSTLARCYPMSFAAVQKHVAILEHAGLVSKRRCGREQLVTGNVDTVRKASRLLDQVEALWKDRIHRIGEILADDAVEGAPK